MRSAAVALALCWALLASCAEIAAQPRELWDRHLKGHHGPYRGRVVDAETKAPLKGAVVVALWRRDRVMPFHASTEHYAVRETLTDDSGAFVIDGGDVELTASRRVHRPTFTIFTPGYGSFPNFQVAPRGFIGGVFEGAGVTVELPRLKTREERLDNVRTLSPAALTDSPSEEIPHFMRLLDEERLAIGLPPYRPRDTRE